MIHFFGFLRKKYEQAKDFWSSNLLKISIVLAITLRKAIQYSIMHV